MRKKGYEVATYLYIFVSLFTCTLTYFIPHPLVCCVPQHSRRWHSRTQRKKKLRNKVFVHPKVANAARLREVLIYNSVCVCAPLMLWRQFCSQRQLFSRWCHERCATTLTHTRTHTQLSIENNKQENRIYNFEYMNVRKRIYKRTSHHMRHK